MGTAARAAGYSTHTASPSSAPARAARGPDTLGASGERKRAAKAPKRSIPAGTCPKAETAKGYTGVATA